MKDFLLGGCMMACAVAGLMFYQYYRRTRDRLFAIFAVAFFIMAINRTGLAIVEHGNEGLAGRVELTFVGSEAMERGCVRLSYSVGRARSAS